MARLRRGDLPPRILHPPPGPVSRRLSRQLDRYEAPGINTLGSTGSSIVWQEARGSNVLDVDGNRYLDLTSGFGVAAVGHRHPKVVTAVRNQAGDLIHGLADVHAHPLRLELARRLARLAPVNNAQVFFAVSGSDAIEVALKTALLSTGRSGVLAFEPAYHGLSLGALQVTSRPHFRYPFAAHFHSNIYRLPYGCPSPEIDNQLRSHPDTACVIVEPVVGREGVLVPPAGWLRDLRQACTEHGVLLIADEIFTGCGRTGYWFAVENETVKPDLLCCGKALAGGLPIAAVVGRRSLFAAWECQGEALHTGTFVAHPVSCAAALATLDIIKSERLPRRAARLGRMVGKRLRTWPRRSAAVLSVRGRGLLWAVELSDRTAAHRLTDTLAGQGVLALAGGPEGRVVQLVPPLVITESLLWRALDIVESSLGEI